MDKIIESLVKIENRAKEIDKSTEFQKNKLLESNEEKINNMINKLDKFVRTSVNEIENNMRQEFEEKTENALELSEKRILNLQIQFEENHEKWEQEIFDRIFA